jgi:hypothetical protein
MIRGMHAMFYSSKADELRAFLRDKLSLSGTDVGGGWLTFSAPEAELGVHPTEGGEPASGTADISFYCDNIEETVRGAHQSWGGVHSAGGGPRLRAGHLL